MNIVKPGPSASPSLAPPPQQMGQEAEGIGLRTPIVAGILVIALFFGVFGGWAALAPLDSAAIAPGVVIVDTNRKTVQHLEGGIIGRINIRDGDKVAAGQVVIELDETQPRATLDLLRGRKIAATALAARLVAERDGKETIEFPDWLLAERDDPKATEALNGQTNIFKARRKAIAGQVAILNQRISQFSEEIIGLEGQIKAENTQIRLIAEEIDDVRGLVEKGLARKPRLLALQRGIAEIEGSLSQNRAQIARAGQNIAEARLHMNELKTKMMNEVVQELREVQAELFDLVEQHRAAADVLLRTEIRSPLEGTVVGLQVHTPGGGHRPWGALVRHRSQPGPAGGRSTGRSGRHRHAADRPLGAGQVHGFQHPEHCPRRGHGDRDLGG